MGSKLMNQHIATDYCEMLCGIAWTTFRRFITDASTVALFAMAAAGVVLLGALGMSSELTLAWLIVAFALFAAMMASFYRNRESRESSIRSFIEKRFRIRGLNASQSQDFWGSARDFVALLARLENQDPSEQLKRAVGRVFDLLSVYADSLRVPTITNAQRASMATDIGRLVDVARRQVTVRFSENSIVQDRTAREIADQCEAAFKRAIKTLADAVEKGIRGGFENSGLVEEAELQSLIPVELRQARSEVESRLTRVGFQQGINALGQLNDQFDRLTAALGRKQEANPIGLTQVTTLVQEAYRQALSSLDDAGEIAAVLNSPERSRLRQEVEGMEAEVAVLKAQEPQSERVRLKEARLQSHRQRLRSLDTQEIRLEELLNQCESCEATLGHTRIELTALRGDSSAASISAVTDALRRTVEQARGVQIEVNNLRI